MKITTPSSVFIVSVFISYLQSSTQNVVTNRPIKSQFHVSTMRREIGHDILTFPDEKNRNPDPDCEPSEGKKVGAELDRFASEPCPNDSLFCDNVDEYPTDQIKNLLKSQPKALDHFYTEDEVETDTSDRFGDNDEVPLCASRKRVIYPKKAKSTENVFEFVVNDDEHKQGVRVEECVNAGNECEIIGSALPLGYRSHCVQKYVTRSLIIAESNSGSVSGIVSKPFMIPSCCSCSLILDHTTNRFGSPTGESASKNGTRTTAQPKDKKN